MCGITAAGSERLINRCLDAGHKQCYDAGGTGFMAMVVVGMLGASLLSAWIVARD